MGSEKGLTEGGQGHCARRMQSRLAPCSSITDEGNFLAGHELDYREGEEHKYTFRLLMTLCPLLTSCGSIWLMP